MPIIIVISQPRVTYVILTMGDEAKGTSVFDKIAEVDIIWGNINLFDCNIRYVCAKMKYSLQIRPE